MRDVEAAHVRQTHVEQHGVGAQLADEEEGVLPTVGRMHRIAGVGKGFVQEEGGYGGIFRHDQPRSVRGRDGVRWGGLFGRYGSGRDASFGPGCGAGRNGWFFGFT